MALEARYLHSPNGVAAALDEEGDAPQPDVMIIGLLFALYCLQLFCALALLGCAITEIWWEIFCY